MCDVRGYALEPGIVCRACRLEVAYGVLGRMLHDRLRDRARSADENLRRQSRMHSPELLIRRPMNVVIIDERVCANL